MSTLGRMWSALWRTSKRDEEWLEKAEAGTVWVRPAFRLAIVFALLFAGVFFALWWAGSAVRFGAARVTGRTVPTWRVWGTVRDALTHQPIPWAAVEDDPAGQPPLFRVDAEYSGTYELLTLAEPHRIRVSAPGYRPLAVDVGRAWFLWMPQGSERKNIELLPLLGRCLPPQRGEDSTYHLIYTL
jgi:hypothetical protein